MPIKYILMRMMFSCPSYKQLINIVYLFAEVLNDMIYLYHGINIQYNGSNILLPLTCSCDPQTI